MNKLHRFHQSGLGWPLFVLTLLGVGMVTSLSVVFFAHRDGGAQVVDDYYQQAVRWDVVMAEREASLALGWTATVGPGVASGTVLLTVEDRTGRPVAGLGGVVGLTRPQYTALLAERALVADPTHPGQYTLALPEGAAGLWDLEVRATLGTEPFWARLRYEVR